MKTECFGIGLIAMLGPLGACAYIAGFAVPIEWNLPLIILAAASLSAAIFDFDAERYTLNFSLMTPVLIFLGLNGLSTITSTDINRSLQMSTPLLPAVLLFLLIALHFRRIQAVQLLYLTFSIVGAGLALEVLHTLYTSGVVDPNVWPKEMANPIIVVPNDLAILSLLTPLSFVLLYREPRSISGVVAGLSILLSVAAITAVQSRVASLTMLLSLTCAAALIRPRWVLMLGSAAMLLVVIIDGLFGFPLSTKFGNIVDTRFAVWAVALSAFLDAPILGHGPHTFALFYHTYLSELPIPSWLPVDVRGMPWAHNLYLETLGEQGMLGLFGLGFLLYRGLSLAWVLQRSAAKEVQLFAAGGLAGLVGFCFAAVVELTLLRLWVAVVMFSFLGVIASLSSLQERK